MIELTSGQSSLMMLEVAKIVSIHNERNIGTFEEPFDDDFIDFYCELDADMMDITSLRRTGG